MSSPLSAPAGVSVRGHRAYQRPARPVQRVLATLVDLATGAIVLILWVRQAGILPIPRLWWPLAALFLAALFWVLGRLFTASSPGERVWELRPVPAPDEFLARFAWPVHHSGSKDPTTREILRSRASFLTAGALLAVPLAAGVLLASPPIWLRAELSRQEPLELAQLFEAAVGASPGVASTAPAPIAGEKDWVVTPFYYALGAWPRVFSGAPVFYSIPYEKGPPSRFIGHIIARWDAPEVKLTYEGPRTAGLLADGRISRADLEICLALPASASPSCLRARDEVLGRHLREIQKTIDPRPASWRLRWLLVDNPSLPADGRVQGVYLSARGETRGQDRFTLVLPNGAEQTMILDYPAGTQRGELAQDAFMKSIRSLRVSPDLAQGRRWAEREIENIRLDDLEHVASKDELIARIAEIQTVLLGKLSVDPKTYDTYFHLAGTASLLAGEATRQGREEWMGVARPLIQNLALYAKDISPDDPRTAQLDRLWLQVKGR